VTSARVSSPPSAAEEQLVYRAARWKGWVEILSGVALGVGGRVAWITGHPLINGIGALVTAALLAALVWDDVRAVFGRRALIFSRQGVGLSTWGHTSFLPWENVRAVAVFSERGAAMLQIVGTGWRQGSLTWGWNDNAYDIVDDVQALRARWEGVPDTAVVTPEDREASQRRNHARWLGMSLALAGDGLVALALMIKEIREKGPDDDLPASNFSGRPRLARSRSAFSSWQSWSRSWACCGGSRREAHARDRRSSQPFLSTSCWPLPLWFNSSRRTRS
jgi:hypothetical protein